MPADTTIDITRADGSVVKMMPLPTVDDDTARLIRSYLNLNCGPNRAQVLRYNHIVQLKYIPKDTTEEPIYYQLNDRTREWADRERYMVGAFKPNYLLQQLGGEDIAVASVSNLVYTAELVDGINFIFYQDTPLELDGEELERNTNDFFILLLNKFNSNSVTLRFLPVAEADEYILMYYNKFDENVDLKVMADAPGMEIFNHQQAVGNVVTLESGINIIKLPRAAGIKELYVSHTGTLGETDNDALYLGRIRLVSGYNAALKTMDMTGVLTRIKDAATVDGLDQFYYLYQPGSEEAMDTTNLLAPESL